MKMFTSVTQKPHSFLVINVACLVKGNHRETEIVSVWFSNRSCIRNYTKTFVLILDSRNRTSNNVYNATFQLTKPISRVHKLLKVRVKHVQFANTLCKFTLQTAKMYCFYQQVRVSLWRPGFISRLNSWHYYRLLLNIVPSPITQES
jgi:hypothetical protein